MPENRADYVRARLSTLLGFRGYECHHATKRGLSVVSEIKLGDPEVAKKTITGWNRADLEATVLVLAAMVDDSKTLPELLNPIVELMANPPLRCEGCNAWFNNRAGTRFCGHACQRRHEYRNRRRT